MKCPSIIDVRDVVQTASMVKAEVPIAGVLTWVPARAQYSPETFMTRLRATWLVFTGRADAVTWPGQ